MSRLREQYENEIKDAMIKKFGYKNAMEIPKLDKIVVNMGVDLAKRTFLSPSILNPTRVGFQIGRAHV